MNEEEMLEHYNETLGAFLKWKHGDPEDRLHLMQPVIKLSNITLEKNIALFSEAPVTPLGTALIVIHFTGTGVTHRAERERLVRSAMYSYFKPLLLPGERCRCFGGYKDARCEIIADAANAAYGVPVNDLAIANRDIIQALRTLQQQVMPLNQQLHDEYQAWHAARRRQQR